MRVASLLWYSAFFWVVILSFATLEYMGFRPDTGFLQLKQSAIASGWYLPAFYSHIFGSAVILLCGLFQFRSVVQKRIRLHRFLGRIYVYGLLLLAAPGAYIMTFFINRGTGVFLSFFIQNSLWIVFTIAAILAVRRGDLHKHVLMMRRSYALAFAAVTLRFYIWLFHIFGNGVQFENNYIIIAILSWVPNLLLVELINRMPLVFKQSDSGSLAGK